MTGGRRVGNEGHPFQLGATSGNGRAFAEGNADPFVRHRFRKR